MKVMILNLIFISFLSTSCNQESNDKNEIKDKTKSYNKICIEGHVYFSGFRKLAVKLDNNGKPVDCQ